MLIKAILDLKQGIESKNWELVESAYQYLTGERSSDNGLMAAVEPNKVTKKTPLKSKILAEKKLVTKKAKIKGRTKPLLLITDEADAELQEHNESVSVPKEYRPEQRETSVSCSKCGNKFILEKVYPLGVKSTKELKYLRCGPCSNTLKGS